MTTPPPSPIRSQAPAGTCLIETMRVDTGRGIALLEGHMSRLSASCRALGYRYDEARVRAAVNTAAAALPADGHEYRMRLLVDADGSPAVETALLPPLPGGQRAALAARRLDPDEALLRHKTTHRPWYVEAAGWLAAHPDHFDVLYLNTREELCEGSRSNVYLLRDGLWLTPPAACGLLPGVQRAALLAGGQVREAVLTLEDLCGAEAVRLSNGLRGWFDVTPDLADTAPA